ncbi:DUF6122 family protein [Aquimarina sp. D1M17]|uniref:DUF6122 family protein n=1 Tax=Aquimarina acroporae TaxID=2937283 RepID=UPI0020C1125F|nr:DUF6122 family protein [Aquimarina acroporae]MCK8522802.1 DUF6122 family protein [Aquimarina acroporae]
MLQSVIHYSFHLLLPLVFAYFSFPKRWKSVYFIFLCSMLIDLDHLTADPIFDPNRCSVGFHFLHSYLAIAAYLILLFFSKTRIIGVALLWHIITDIVDCSMM